MGRKKKSATSAKADSQNNDGASGVAIDDDRLQAAKECESLLESNRLSFEEAKAKHVMARAEHKLLIARRNIAIAKATDAAEVEDAQRLVDNAKIREVKAKSIRDSAKDEWKGAEERLAKIMTEKMPLFD